MKSTNFVARPHTVPALDRMMGLLTQLERMPAGGGLRELAQRCRIPRTTAYRILNTLEAHRVVARGADGSYRLGSRLVSLAAGVAEGAAWRELAARAAPLLQALADASGETARLSVLDGDAALCVAVAQGHGADALAARLGGRYPLHAGAASKVLLAAMPAAAREAVLAGTLPACSARTITDPAALRHELARVRARGWARDDGEYSVSTHALAVPLPTAPHAPLAAVSLAFVGGREPADERRLVALLRREVAARWRQP
jgi:DNA-binding IclR family transcriptional regulator